MLLRSRNEHIDYVSTTRRFCNDDKFCIKVVTLALEIPLAEMFFKKSFSSVSSRPSVIEALNQSTKLSAVEFEVVSSLPSKSKLQKDCERDIRLVWITNLMILTLPD